MRNKTIFIATVSLIASWYTVNALHYTRVIRTTYGRVRGEEVTVDGIRFNAFKGIPYAKPPIGQLRFRAPQPPRKWSRVKNAVHYGSVCMGNPESNPKLGAGDVVFNLPNLLTFVAREIVRSEDCLTLNVFTTQYGEKGLRPVLVFIPGGGFVASDGTDSLYGPEYLVNEDIVVVTMNYRLGPLGFLSTNTSHASGNWGLKDQVAALKWVQENIAQFGGDPQRVTLYGQSAGGASAHLHLFSPLSRGLFHQVIASSGTATCDWALLTHQERVSKRLAKLVGASERQIRSPAARVRFLRGVKADKLVDRLWDVLQNQDYTYKAPHYIPFAPVVEPAGTQNAFLTEDPQKLIVEGKFARVPLMIGYNSLEAAVLFLGSKLTVQDLRKMDLDVCKTSTEDFQRLVRGMNSCPDVSRRVLEVYFRGRPTTSSLLQTVNLLGDTSINFNIRQTQKWHARFAAANSPTYLYYFTFDGKWNVFKKWFSLDTLPGATHTDDLSYVFDERIKYKPPVSPNSPEKNTRKRMISFITNFVKYGNPTPSVSSLVPVQWKPAIGNDTNTMIIGEDLTFEKDIERDRINLWRDLFREYAGPRFYTL